MKEKISLVIPVYNEENNLIPLYAILNGVIQKNADSFDYEIILVNDGSKDNSWNIIKKLAAVDPVIKAINFSRNFGHQIALTAGYDIATGDAIITMDADLQDPPQLLFSMIELWKKGNLIVYARRANRSDTFLKKYTALIYYKFLDYIADVKIPRNVGDFRLIDKKVLKVLKKCPEKSRYLRGMVAWTGFKHDFVDFNRSNRNTGSTGYTWNKMFKLAFDGVTAFSLFPLKIAAFVGLFVVATGMLMFSYITVDALIFGIDYPLFKWLVTIIYIFMGLQFILLWLVGEYIGRIHEQQKNRPLYLIDELTNFETKISFPNALIVEHETIKELTY